MDVLVYEAMRFSFFDGMPERRRFVTDYHADTPLIGKQAAELGVATLVLTHLIPAPATKAEKQLFVDDIRSGGYEGEVIVADDLDTVAIGSGGLPDGLPLCPFLNVIVPSCNSADSKSAF